MMHRVMCLDTKQAFWFKAQTPYLAMKALIYYLNLSHRDTTAKVEKTESGRFLYTVHNGKTWSVSNQHGNK